jgi:hypothetical protein
LSDLTSSEELAPYYAWRRRLAAEGKAPCPDCDGRTLVHMVGEDLPCPTCQSKAYEEALRERRIDESQFGAGA